MSTAGDPTKSETLQSALKAARALEKDLAAQTPVADKSARAKGVMAFAGARTLDDFQLKNNPEASADTSQDNLWELQKYIERLEKRTSA